MVVKIYIEYFQLCLVSFSCSTPICQNLLFGVTTTDGKFYTRTFPQYASDNWLGHATEIGAEGWNDFKFLFFHPDGTLYGVLNDKFYKGSPPDGESAKDWVAKATIVGMLDGMASSSCSSVLKECSMAFTTTGFTRGSRQHTAVTTG